MTAPSTFHNAAHDGRKDVETIDAVEVDDLVSVSRPGTMFSARYADRCVSCSSRIERGDAVTYGLDGELEHVDCPDPLEVPKQGMCGRCFLVLPLTGVCGVCE